MADKKTLHAEQLDELRAMYERGERLQKIASSFDISPKTLQSTLKDLSLARPPLSRKSRRRQALDPGQIEAILWAYDDPSQPISKILAEFNIPLSRLYSELQKAGRPKRKLMPSKSTSLPSSERSRIVDSYAAGMSAKSIAENTGLNYDQVYVVLRENGTALKADHAKLPHNQAEIRERFRALYSDEKISVAEIITQLGISQHGFKQLLHDLGLQKRGKGGGMRSISQQIIEKMPEYARRYEAGESLSKLAAEAGIGLATMKVRLKKIQKPNQP